MIKRASTAGRKRVRFAIKGDPGQTVAVAGNFNNWDPRAKPLTYKNGEYSGILMLPKGRYEYKFIIDGSWCIDPDCLEWTTNEMGSLNSVRTVN